MTIETIIHDGQILRITSGYEPGPDAGPAEYLMVPNTAHCQTIGPFFTDSPRDRELMLEIGACHLSHGQPCPHGHTYVDGDRCEDCDAATAGDIRSHYERENPDG